MSFSVKKRIELEKQYWDLAAQDPNVDTKYICDQSKESCLSAIGSLKGRVLEIGCGVGRLMKTGYFGVDISEKMLELAKINNPDCIYSICDGRTIPYDDNYFNSIYCILVFQHLPLEAIETYIKEVSRVLKNKGLFRFQFIEGVEQEPFSHHYQLEEIKDILNTNDFYLEKVDKRLVHKQWTWITATKNDTN